MGNYEKIEFELSNKGVLILRIGIITGIILASIFGIMWFVAGQRPATTQITETVDQGQEKAANITVSEGQTLYVKVNSVDDKVVKVWVMEGAKYDAYVAAGGGSIDDVGQPTGESNNEGTYGPLTAGKYVFYILGEEDGTTVNIDYVAYEDKSDLQFTLGVMAAVIIPVCFIVFLIIAGFAKDRDE